MTFRHDVSEDLVHGVFERVLKYRTAYTGNGDFSTWLFTIARNHYNDYFRKNDKNPVELPDLDWDRLESDHPGNGEPSDEEQKKCIVQQSLQKLDPEKRQVLVLSRFEGFKYSEIAGILECSEGAVKVRVYRALSELKVILTDLKKKEDL
jgi:RNA polymerase sigma-70 factor (ECF subfamily)